MIFASIFEETPQQMAGRAADALSAGADGVELRVDALRKPDESALELLSSIKGRKILTLKGRSLSLLNSPSVRHFDFLDIDWKEYAPHLVPVRGPELILSSHSAFTRSSAARFISRALEHGAIAKCVETRDGYSASLSLMRAASAFRRKSRIIAFATGEKGVLSRIASMRSGSPVQYAHAGRPVATGQLSVREMAGARDGVVLGILGSREATEHSISPHIHSRLLQLSGMSGAYLRFPAEASELSSFFECAKMADIRGFNVTMPFKLKVLRYAEKVDRIAEAAGAANTILFRKGRAQAYNTDVLALQEIVEGLDCSTALIYGTGGAARAAAYVLQSTACSIAGRSETARRKIARDFAVRAAAPSPGEYDLLVNCTPLGMHEGDELPSIILSSKFRHVIDFVYGGTGLFRQFARRSGCGFTDGKELLLRQALHSFRIWTGRKVDLKMEEVFPDGPMPVH